MSDKVLIPPSPAGGFAAISKYNPHLWSAEQLRAIFVARQAELADLLRTLHTTPPGTVGQHALLVGARGMGKSTLMQRLALAVEDDADLAAAWLPLRFPEEQYTVATVSQFWANVLDSLADALERQGQPADDLDAAAGRIAALPSADQAAAYLAAIDACADAQGQRLLLLVDNADLLLHNIGRDAHWALRETLQSNPRLLWIGGSYQSLEADSDYHDAFLDFFRVVPLRPLRQEEMEEALLALAETFGGPTARQTMARQLAAQPERLPTLRQLSGGNPRTTVMLYELFANGQKSSVRGDLEALLDNMTPLYKARMDSLSDLPRKLLAHLLEHWAPISLGELSQVAQVASTTVSPQLQRLQLEGLIEKTPLHGTTRSGYQAAERFFNIWYLMRLSPRRQRARLAWLVEFMRLWFSADELCGLARQRIGRATNPSAHDWEYDRALADALPAEAGERHALRWSLLKQLQDSRAQLCDIFDLDGEDGDFKDAADYLRRLATLPDLLRRCPHADTEEDKISWIEAVIGSLSLSLAEKERVAQSAASLSRFQYDELRKVFGEENKVWEDTLGTAAQFLRAAVLHRDFFPDLPDSHLAYEQIRACFADQPQALRFASELFFRKHEDIWCLKTLELAQQALPNDSRIAAQRGWLLHERLERYDEAEVAYRRAIALDEKYALPWTNLGGLLQDRGRYEEAEAAYRRAIALDDKDAWPWNGLGNLLINHLGRYDEAEAAYRQAIVRNEKNASPWNGLGNVLMDHLGRYDEAETAYRHAILLNQKPAVPWNNLGNLLQSHLARYDEAEAAYRHAIELDEKYASPWNGIAELLKNHLSRYEEAEAAYRHAIALNDKNASPWNGLGDLLQTQGRHDEAENAYREAMALKDARAWPKANFARLLARSGRKSEAESLFRDAAAQAGPGAQNLLLQAHLFLGNRQLALDALHALARAAQEGHKVAFFQLKEQVWECHELGLGERLADWMAESGAADFLLPFIQALYLLVGADAKLRDLPQETQRMADEIVGTAQTRGTRQPTAATAQPGRKTIRRRRTRP